MYAKQYHDSQRAWRYFRYIVAQVSTFDTIIAIENIAINQNIEISPNPSKGATTPPFYSVDW
jgi:hypothetical protein